MNKTSFGFHCDNACLTIGKGVIEAAIKNAGITVISIHSIFDKSYKGHAEFCKELYYKVFMNNSGKPKRIILNLAYAPWIHMTPKQAGSVPVKFIKSAAYSNRWFPADVALYRTFLEGFLTELQRYPDMNAVIAFDLAQEPNADRYWWDTTPKCKDFIILKLEILNDQYEVFGFHTTTGLLVKPSSAKPQYLDFINQFNFDLYDAGFSTSVYAHTKHGWTDWNKNYFPDRTFQEILFPECGKYAAVPKGSAIEADFLSPKMMQYYCDFLKWSFAKAQTTVSQKHTIIWYTLYACSTEADKGDLAYWKKNPKNGTYEKRASWDHLVAFLSVVKDGWLPTPTGVKGATKEIRLTADGYEIIDV